MFLFPPRNIDWGQAPSSHRFPTTCGVLIGWVLPSATHNQCIYEVKGLLYTNKHQISVLEWNIPIYHIRPLQTRTGHHPPCCRATRKPSRRHEVHHQDQTKTGNCRPHPDQRILMIIQLFYIIIFNHSKHIFQAKNRESSKQSTSSSNRSTAPDIEHLSICHTSSNPSKTNTYVLRYSTFSTHSLNHTLASHHSPSLGFGHRRRQS